jgi:DNA-binding NtrC family response regulator
MTDSANILVVDDDPGVQASLCAFLEDEGFLARSTGNPDSALGLIAAHPIAVAIVDIRLGGIGGEELIARAHRVRATTRFFIFTGSLDYVLPDSLKERGVESSHVFYKPLRSLSIVGNEIRRVLARKEQENVPH